MATKYIDNIDEMKKKHELVAQHPSEDCGCPEEEWIMNNLFVIIHLENDGTGHAFIDCGDWEDERLFDVTTMPALRQETENWINSIPTSTQL